MSTYLVTFNSESCDEYQFRLISDTTPTQESVEDALKEELPFELNEESGELYGSCHVEAMDSIPLLTLNNK